MLSQNHPSKLSPRLCVSTVRALLTPIQYRIILCALLIERFTMLEDAKDSLERIREGLAAKGESL